MAEAKKRLLTYAGLKALEDGLNRSSLPCVCGWNMRPCKVNIPSSINQTSNLENPVD